VQIVLLIALSFVNINYVFNNSGTPPASLTGAPGENTCAQTGCHGTGSATFDPAKIEIKLDTLAPFGVNPIDSSFQYWPNKNYKVIVSIEFLPNRFFGFQMAVLDTNNNSIGTLIAQTNTGIQNAMGREYINHTTSSANKSWAFQWDSPSNYAGPITFHATAVRGVPDSTADFLDDVFRTQVTIQAVPGIPVGLTSSREASSWRIFPNPATAQVQLQMDQPVDDGMSITLLQMNGRAVHSVVFPAQGSQTTFRFQLPSELASGLYWLHLEAGKEQAVRKLLVE